MKRLFCLLAAVPAFAAEAGVGRVEWEGLDRERLHLVIYLKPETRIPVTVRGLRFEEMNAGGIPFRILQPETAISLPRAEPLRLPVTVELRDLADLAAIRHMVESATVAIRGRASFEVSLPLLYRILFFSSSIPVRVPIAHDVPFTIPGGALGRAAALAAISALESGLSWRTTEMKPARSTPVLNASENCFAQNR
jgi:hypothetical protein